MNGYSSVDLLGRTGKNLSVTVNGQHMVFRGQPATPCTLTLNGAEGVPSALVYAGDSIEFTPAVQGAPAQRTLKDLLGADFIGGVMVNGRMADLETRLNTGDQIVTSDHPVRPAQTASAYRPSPPPEPPRPEPVRAEFSRAREEPPRERPSRAEPPKREERAPAVQTNPWEKRPAERPVQAESPAERPAERPVQAEPPAQRPAERPVQAAPPPPQPAPSPAPKAEEPPQMKKRGIQVMLNGKQLSLPGKEDETPYYVMDLLDFSGIDFEHLDRGVELQVNGRECAFTQELRPQDDVIIRYLEQ